MADRPIDQLTLRDIFSESEWLIRELAEHLKQSFHPKARALRELVRSYKIPDERNAIADSAVRTHVAALISSDEYSQTLIQKLDGFLTAIEERSQWRSAANERRGSDGPADKSIAENRGF